MTAQLPRVRLPGLCWKKANADEPLFMRGVVVLSGWGQLGPTTQTIETDSKLIKIVKLVGDTYAYWCHACQRTIWEQQLIMHAGAVRAAGRNDQKCVFCIGPIRTLDAGDKVRVHYRFSPKAEWGAWWAERWEW